MGDPGFPVRGRRPRRGGVDSRGGYVLKILYAETKESGPLGGVSRAYPLDLPIGGVVLTNGSPNMFVHVNKLGVLKGMPKGVPMLQRLIFGHNFRIC